jgi:hypothetical protein
MDGAITLYTSIAAHEESDRMREALQQGGFPYQEKDVSTKPGKKVTSNGNQLSGTVDN